MSFHHGRRGYSRTLVGSFGLAIGTSLVAACSGGSVTGPQPIVLGTSNPSATGVPAKTSGVLAPNAATTPSPMPTGNAAGYQCSEPGAHNLPGYYTSIALYGNISGHTYTEDYNSSGGDQGYVVSQFYTPTPATPQPTPTYSTPTASPIPTPTPEYERFTTYYGYDVIPGFEFTYDGGTGVTNGQPGCIYMFLIQPADGTAGMARKRSVGSFGGDNTELLAQVEPEGAVLESNLLINNSSSLYNSISNVSLDNITASSGSGSFTLDNGLVGTLTIIGSDSIITQTNSERPTFPHIESKLPKFTPHIGEPPPGAR